MLMSMDRRQRNSVWNCETPKDDLPLAIVESQYEAGVNGSSDGDASFRPTPRKTLAEVLQTKQAAEGTNIDSMDIHSDLADMSDSFAMRPAKRIRALNRDFGESNAQNSGSNCFSSVMIKKENYKALSVDFSDEYSISNAYNVSDIFVNPTSAEAHAFIEMLPKDNMSLSIVEANPNRAISGVSDKDDFFVHTSRKNIAELFCTKQASEDTMVPYMSAQSDAPEANLTLPRSSSPSSVSIDQSTPAKRLRGPVLNLQEAFDESSVSKKSSTMDKHTHTTDGGEIRAMGSAEDESRNIHSVQRDARANRRQILGNKRNFNDIHSSNTESADLLESSSTEILTRRSFCNGIVLTEVPLSEGYAPIHKGAKRQQVRQQTSNQVRMDVNTVAWSSTTRMKAGRIQSNIICSNTQQNVSNSQQTMNLSGEVVTQKEDLRQNNRETNSRSTIFNDITNVLGTSNRVGTNQRPVQVGQKRKLSRRDSICVSPGVDNANQNSRGTDLDCPVKKKSKGQEIMKPDTLLNVSKNNSVTISQPVKDPDFITWSSTLSSIRRHDTGLVIDCDPTQPLDKSFAPEVDVSCQTAPEVETFTTVDESDEEDSGDEYWDCSSNDADDLNSDSDIDENE
uniref:Uncharacterized protein n=1 Tax=Brassica campestris TaxID=3711 RepID=M4E1C7_BRACM